MVASLYTFWFLAQLLCLAQCTICLQGPHYLSPPISDLEAWLTCAARTRSLCSQISVQLSEIRQHCRLNICRYIGWIDEYLQNKHLSIQPIYLHILRRQCSVSEMHRKFENVISPLLAVLRADESISKLFQAKIISSCKCSFNNFHVSSGLSKTCTYFNTALHWK